MKEEIATEKKQSSIFVPFLVGGLIGAGIALLLAPKSGKELRKDIKDLASDTRGKVSTTIDKGKDLYDETKSAVMSAIEAGKTAYIEERDKIRHAA
jgi:gas vesicle protein